SPQNEGVSRGDARRAGPGVPVLPRRCVARGSRVGCGAAGIAERTAAVVCRSLLCARIVGTTQGRAAASDGGDGERRDERQAMHAAKVGSSHGGSTVSNSRTT